MAGAVDGFCSACAAPAVTDDGRLTACNGPAYFAPASSPLIVGSLRTEPLAALLERHREDPILDTIRTFGPTRLRDELRALPGFERFPFRARYLGICDLCLHVTSDAAAVAALRARLEDPALAAERRAAWLVIQDSRRRGALNPGHINGAGAGRVFLRAAAEPGARWTDEAAWILARPDVDWKRWGSYLAACGLARPLLPALDDAELLRWAPAFFTETLRATAVRDGIVGLVQHEVLRQVGIGLRAIGARGVLLKGMALQLLAREQGSAVPPRATGDVDVYVGPEHGPALRRRLLELGFQGDPAARPTSPHHLASVVLQGISVEIHTRIAAPFWGLPEAEMLGRARPLGLAEGFDALDAEGLLLHALVHCSQSCFSHGLRAAWDVLQILQDRARARLGPAGAVGASGCGRPGASGCRRRCWPASWISRFPPTSCVRCRATRSSATSRRWPDSGSSGSRSAPASSTRSAGTRCSCCCTTRSAPACAISARWAAGPRCAPAAGRRRAGRRDTQVGPLRQAWRHFRQYRRAVTRAVADED